jgi:rubrerythrin
MNTKPSYLGLLNSIANGESAAECYLEVWANTTTRDDVSQVIRAVAAREGEHGKSFAKRINELGFSVVPRSDGKEGDRMAIASSTTLTDREKFEKLGLGRPPAQPDQRDVFSGFLDDSTIDIATGTLLGRYISEERDSGRMLRACYEALCREDHQLTSRTETAPIEQRLSAFEDRLCRIESMLEKLAQPC